jgi:hypothetical protein
LNVFLISIIAAAINGQAQAADCHFYEVNLNGNSTFNGTVQQFSVNEYAWWRTQGIKINPIEFGLTTFKDLNVSAQPGQIELMTNSAFAKNRGIALAKYDLAKVSIVNGSPSAKINFQLDPTMNQALPPPNVFVTQGVGSQPGGLGGLGFLTGSGSVLAQLINGAPVLSVSYIVPRTGAASIYSPDGTWSSIAGTIDFSGASADNPNVMGQYRAKMIGRYVTSVPCN